MPEKSDRPTIGVVVSPDISIEGSSGAEEHVLYDIGRMINDEFRIDIVGGNRLSERLQARYENYNYLGIRLFESTPINALILPLKVLNTLLYAIHHRPDILFHIGGTGTNGMAIVVAGRIVGIPAITRNTGDTFNVHHFQSGYWNTLTTWVKSTFLSQISLRGADRIITLGKKLKQSLVERGVSEGKIEIIPQPLDLSNFEPPADKVAAKAAVNLPVDKTVALTVARLEKEKGADRLVKIIRSTLDRDDEIAFCVIGRGEFKDEIESLAKNDRVQYHEFVPHEDIPDIYQAADVFVLPSRVEGVPNVILESLACDVPVLASPVGEVPYMLDETCDSEAEFIERLVERSFPKQRFPDEYTWDALSTSYNNLFKDEIDGK